MNRITQFVHGTGTVSEVLRRETRQPLPSRLLAFSELRRPVVFWNITRRCNLLCSHCYMEAGPGPRRDDELTTEEAKGLIDDLAGMRIPLLLFSGGEPLVRDDFWELARHAAARNLTMAVSTNGTRITPAVARRLKKVGVEYAGISLDGASRETHDRMRNVAGSFERAVRGLKSCVAAGLKCGIRVTATRDNYTEIPDLIDLALEIGVPRFCVYWLVPSGRGTALHAERQLRPREIREILDLLHRKARELGPSTMELLTVDAPQDTVYLMSTLQMDDPPAYASLCTLLERSGVGCSAGDRVANIDPAGDIYPCQFAQMEALKIGSIRERRFSEIWNDPQNSVLSLFRTKTERLQGACGRCSHKSICGGGCRIRAFTTQGDLWAEDPLCPLCGEERLEP